ncbi:MAG: hypothetical protein ACEPOZ_10375 [Marinifilaceae bacterium]
MKTLHLILFLVLNLTLAAQTAENTLRALVMPKNIEHIIAMETKLAEHYTMPAPKDSSWFEYRSGSNKVLITAGHATAHLREGKVKRADGGTGSLGMELHKLRDVPLFFTKYQSPSDPNYYDANAFKDSLAVIIRQVHPTIVIDLHCSHPYRPFDIDFGTMNGESCLTRMDLLDSLKTALHREGLINQSQDYFAAAKHHTITKFVVREGVPCIQMEINANYISPALGNGNGQKTARLLQALLRFIDGVN